MRVLSITDSNGRGMPSVLAAKRDDLDIMLLMVGSVTKAVRAKYDSRLTSINRFRPDTVILHTGHNDLMLHPRHNTSPDHGKYFFPKIEVFRRVLRANHPNACIIYSSVFPRAISSILTVEKKRIYNRVAVRFGAMARAFANREGYVCALNGGLWAKVKDWLEKPKCFLHDGLHLSDHGRGVVANGWIAALPTVLAIPAADAQIP
jgi:lysophospholipase L1-like esterase